jgi:hypothetical protein
MSSTKSHKSASKAAAAATPLQGRWQFAAALVAVAAAVAVALVFSGSSPSDKPRESPPSAPAAETQAAAPLNRALYPTEVHLWAAQCTAPGNLPPFRSWPRRPVSTATAPFTVFAELEKMQQLKRRSPASSSSGMVEWLVAALNKTRANADPVHLRLLLWQLVAHADKQAHRNCFAKVVVDTGLVADVNAAMSDQSVPFSYTLLYLTVYAQLADPVLAQMLVRSAGASPVAPRVNGDTPIQHALYWQV